MLIGDLVFIQKLALFDKGRDDGSGVGLLQESGENLRDGLGFSVAAFILWGLGLTIDEK